MSFNRIPYDTCAYSHVLAETIGPGVYQLSTPPNSCQPCHPTDPYIRLQSVGVSHSRNTSLIDIDSELIGITRNLSGCPERKYLPSKDGSAYCGAQPGRAAGCDKNAKLCVDMSEMIHFGDCFTTTEDTRLSNPPCTLRGTGWNRWEWLCRNPQERVTIPFDYQIDSVLLAKDNHRACIPRPVQQDNAWPTPNNKEPVCNYTASFCPVPLGPPSVQWQTAENMRLM
jgi:hypothetical protein